MSLIARMHYRPGPVGIDLAALWALLMPKLAVAFALLVELADPRGRCNRKAFLNLSLIHI